MFDTKESKILTPPCPTRHSTAQKLLQYLIKKHQAELKTGDVRDVHVRCTGQHDVALCSSIGPWPSRGRGLSDVRQHLAKSRELTTVVCLNRLHAAKLVSVSCIARRRGLLALQALQDLIAGNHSNLSKWYCRFSIYSTGWAMWDPCWPGSHYHPRLWQWAL